MMRLFLLASVFAVTTLALAGCAAEAEPTGGESDPSVALVEPTAPVATIDRTSDARQTAGISQFLPHLSDTARARQEKTWTRTELGQLPAEPFGDPPNVSLSH